MDRDPHDVLGVSRGATPEELRAAWRSVSKRLHPDVGGDPAAFREALSAYRAPSDGGGDGGQRGAMQASAWCTTTDDAAFVWVGEVPADNRWGWRPARGLVSSLAIALVLLVLVVILLAPAIMVAPR